MAQDTECHYCEYDGRYYQDLLQHARDTRHSILSSEESENEEEDDQHADEETGEGGQYDEYDEYYDAESTAAESDSQDSHHAVYYKYSCPVCAEGFDYLWDLKGHQASHLETTPRTNISSTIECYGCYRQFGFYSSMISHLESGNCPSRINKLDLNESAALCFQWKGYLDQDYRIEMLNREKLETIYHDAVYPFSCPDCEAQFPKLLSLFSHVESISCDQVLYGGKIGKLKHWLSNRHDLTKG